MMSPLKSRAVSVLTWFGSFVLVLSFVVVIADAGTAVASNISYVSPDGNVWRMTPDGSKKEQLTTDGTSEFRYKTPSQKDDGTVVAVRRSDSGSSTSFAYFIRPSDKKLVDTWILPKTGAGSFAPFNGGVISPEGGAFFYDWSYFDCWTNPCSSDFKVSVITGPGVTNPCLVNCHSSSIRPRWIPNTPYAGFVDDHFQAVWVQGPGQAEPKFWLGFPDTTSGNVESFDVSADGKAVIEATAEDGERSEFMFWNTNGTPPAGDPAIRCSIVDVAKAPAYPRLSPDGNQVTWQDDGGVYVAPVPARTEGGSCSLQGTKVASGLEPSWGKTSLKSDGPGPGPEPEPGPNGTVAIARVSVGGPLTAGRSGTVKATVTAGAKDVPTVRVCASVPKTKHKLVKVGRCQRPGTIAAGTSKTVRIAVKTARKARGKYRIALKATGSGVPASTGSVVLRVRG